MIRFLRVTSPKEWKSTHSLLSEYYKELQNGLSLSENKYFENPVWVSFEKERIYHLLCSNPEENWPIAVKAHVRRWVSISDIRNTDFADVILDAGIDCSNDTCKNWANNIITSIRKTDDKNWREFQQILKDIISQELYSNEWEYVILSTVVGWISSKLHNDFDSALECFKKVLETYPDFYPIYEHVGYCYYGKKDYQNALLYFKHIINDPPQNFEDLFAIAESFNHVGNYEEAIKFFNLSISVKPQIGVIYNLIALAHYNLKQYDSAIAALHKLFEYNINDASSYILMAICYQQKAQPESEVKYYEQANEIQPLSSENLSSYGFALLKAGKIKQAEVTLQNAILQGSIDASKMNLGHIYLVRRDIEMAKRLYRESKEAFIDQVIFENGLKDDYKYLKQYGVVEQEYNLIIAEVLGKQL